MGGLPVPRHQFQRVRHAGQKDQADREEGNHQDRTLGVCKEKRSGQPEKTGRQQERDQQHDDIPAVPDIGNAVYLRQQAD